VETETATGPSSAARLDDVLAQARPSDPAGLLFARDRIAGTLFGTDAARGLGRFRVLERLGAGGMGVVYAAYDPDLNRGVAVKVVHVPARGREAVLSEARALARLAHPNVVPVYDVGLAADCVYIVMELVRGETLRHWVKGRDRGTVLDAYRQAGDALAAAHSAGLVHRDFKPENAIVGSDGRVRVLDFGLACESADPSGKGDKAQSVAGTPRYMAPEQAAGTPVTPAADQYSFCVALREALADHDADRPSPPLPRWIDAAIVKGCATDPAARFATMPDLLAALARDPARVWRRRIVLSALVGVVGAVAFLAGTARSETCGGGDVELAATWNPNARATELARIASLGPYGRSLAPQLEHALRDHATRWAAGHRDACLAHQRGEQSAGLLDRRMACLARGRAALAAVAAIVGSADAKTLPEVARAVQAIPDPGSCSDIDVLLSETAPPPPALTQRVMQLRDRLEHARVELAAGRTGEARVAAALCVVTARELGYGPLLAEALLLEGRAIMLQDRGASVSVLSEATRVAVLAGADTLAVEAWARRAWAEGTETDPGGALAGLAVVEALAERTPSGRFARALLYNNIGSIELARDQRDRARTAFERALAESQGVTGPGAVELLAVRSNLALVTDDRAASDALLADAVVELARLLGQDHPDTLLIRLIRGTTTMVRLAPAAQFLTAVCEGYALHEPVTNAVLCWTELGFLRSELGDNALAIAAMERAVRVGADDQNPPEVVPYLTLWRGDAKEAIRRLTAALAGLPAQPNEPWWSRLERAERELALGRARRALGDLPAARQALASSAAHLEVIARDHPAAAILRRLGRARAELAMTLAATGAPRTQIAEVAAAAAAWLREAEGSAAEIAALERLAKN
jgi:predicted Ser/Thr protein kinase/tetratricopeptide (TPR) repeat protein